jgi:copper(I)-binding protein
MDPLMKPLKAFLMLSLTSALVLALVVTASCGDDDEDTDSGVIAAVGDLEIVQAFARAVELGGAAYFTIENTGGTDDALIEAASDVARRVELHETVTEEGMHKMQAVEEIAVPAGGEAILEPGGYHVMLIDLKEEQEVGDTFEITLTFREAGSVDLEIEVRSYTE